MKILIGYLMRQKGMVSNFQSLTMNINIITAVVGKSHTFTCAVSTATNITVWTYLNGSVGSVTLKYQNGACNASKAGIFSSDRYSYACNSTEYQITLRNIGGIDKNILNCRDGLRPEELGTSWFLYRMVDDSEADEICNCEPPIQFTVEDATEGENITFICRVSSNVPYVNWNWLRGSKTAAMGVGLNGRCNTTTGATFLDDNSKYIYTCNRTVYQVTKLNVNRSEQNDMYMCTPSGQTEGTGSNWIVKVKARVTLVTLTPVNSQVNIKENTVVDFTCTTSKARPAASVYWYIHPNGKSSDITRITDNITTTTDYNEFSVITSTLHFVPTRQHDSMKIYCEAKNTVNTSPVKSDKSVLSVQYKANDPYILQGNEYRVIEHTLGMLSCTVKGGNPSPTLSWSCDKFSTTHQSTINCNRNVTTALTWNVLRTHEGNCTCTSTQTGFTNEITSISVVILYSPSKPTFSVNEYIIEGNISFIEGTTRSITCTTDSKPSPDRYTWTGPSDIDSPNQSTLTFNTIERKDAGEYGCSVRNTMNSSDEGLVAGINTSTVNVVVLYPPVALPIQNMSILQRKNLTIRCPYRAGMPMKTSFVWTRNIDDKQWNGKLLYIPSVEKSDAANYFCNVSNVMMPSGESIAYFGHTFQSFYLDVVYEAIVTSFTIDGYASNSVTKNESDPVHFTCNADSNPTATITLSYDNKSLNTTISNNVKHDISQARCLDAGTYVCTAKNMYNKESFVSKLVQLFVNCYPRTAGAIQKNITSEESATITITVNVIAYPPPTFIWYKLIEEKWTILHDDNNYLLSSSGVQSNLTIRSVDKPDPPINFTHIESHTTTSSIHLVWTQGFDNGPPQTFNIKYKKVSDTVWKYLSVTDNGESTMEIQLTGLTENTQYIFVIFASNKMGNSPESSITATTLKVIEKNTPQSPAPLIGGIVGGVIGCSIIVIVIVFIIRRYPYCKVCSGKLARGKSDKTDNTSDEHDYYNTGRSEEIANQDNDDKTYNTIESDANRNNKSTVDFAYYNVANVSEYEKINRTNVEPTLYSSLNQSEQGALSDATNDDKKAVYENMKLQVF